MRSGNRNYRKIIQNNPPPSARGLRRFVRFFGNSMPCIILNVHSARVRPPKKKKKSRPYWILVVLELVWRHTPYRSKFQIKKKTSQDSKIKSGQQGKLHFIALNFKPLKQSNNFHNWFYWYKEYKGWLCVDWCR